MTASEKTLAASYDNPIAHIDSFVLAAPAGEEGWQAPDIRVRSLEDGLAFLAADIIKYAVSEDPAVMEAREFLQGGNALGRDYWLA